MSEGSPPFTLTEVARFDAPWAMTALPDGGLLVTEKAGRLKWWRDGVIRDVAGTPEVDHRHHASFGDVIPGPDYARSGIIYLSWSEAANGTSGTVVGRAKLVLDDTPRLEGLTVIWRQARLWGSEWNYSQRLAFSPDGQYLFITSGDRTREKPAQDRRSNLGKILRLLPDGRPAPGNPFAGEGGRAAEVWSYGHRNLYGLAFDADGRLWEHEMGMQGGDELNLIKPGENYGWPVVSNGDRYSGKIIPDHSTRPEFKAPALWWNPSIAPSGMFIYNGSKFPQWRGDMFIGTLAGQSLIRIDLDGDTAIKADRWDMEARIRDVEPAVNGDIWLLEDGAAEWGGRLLRLSPQE